MPLIESVVALISKLPPSALELLTGLVNSLLAAKSPEDAEERLRKAALAAGYKKAVKAGWRETVKAKGALKKALK